MSCITVTKENFQKEVLESDIPVMVEFWANWCGPCQEMAPILEEIANEHHGEFKICKVNIDEEVTLSTSYSVLAVPSVMVLEHGKIVSASAGAKGKEELLRMFKK